MPEQSSVHSYLNWTKARIDEMDATLASLETNAGQMQADAKTKSERLIAELKKTRDEFQVKAQSQAKASEAAMQASKAQLEQQWHGFEAKVKSYFESAGKQLEQQQATFQHAAAAQVKAWRAAADKFLEEATKIAAARRTDVDAAVKQMKADAAEAEARFYKIKQAGAESWSALSAALAESRKAFDRSNRTTGEAVKKAVPPNAA